MNIHAIKHDPFTGCYAVDKNTLIVKIETGKEVTGVSVFADDPYTSETCEIWHGKKTEMKLKAELIHSLVWETEIVPEYKRLQYYFEITSGNERLYLYDDGIHADEDCLNGSIVQYFKFAWLNPSDVCVVPEWAEDTVWYQIFPDRYRRVESGETGTFKPIEWGKEDTARFDSFYGGNLRGISEKLEYIKGLGITGLYLTPIMCSDTNHRYNVHDYTLVDPQLGSNADLKELIDNAHAMGLRIMLDAVFNHCGTRFFAWQDVVKHGKTSKYYDWFFINSDDFASIKGNTKDGRYFSFAFSAYMPKLNTNNPEVMDYMINVCKSWVALGVDGIRFDVGNEISHTFLKKLRIELKSIKSDLFLLGEIWHRSLPWLLGDEYDSIMNFQFMESVNNFMIDKHATARDLMYSFNETYNNYYRQINGVLFNMLDNHDVVRTVTRCGSIDGMLQELVLLMTMRGSPCIYYGTEIGLEGEIGQSHNRRCMKWRDIDDGKFNDLLTDFREIVAIRNIFLQFKNGDIVWKFDSGSRVVNYIWHNADGHSLEVYLNASNEKITVNTDKTVMYSRKKEGNILLPNGIAVLYK